MSQHSPTLPRLLAVVGPTAGGKTALSLSLAEQLNAEIVLCDSMQIYRGMDIGTAKPTPEELARVPHHLVDIRDPQDSYSCAEYVTDATATLQKIASRGRLPLLCGGTGLYLDALLQGGSFEDTPRDPAIREKLQARAALPGGADELYDYLGRVDPDSAAAIHKNNVKRVIRALEIYECCGTPKSVLDRQSRQRGLRYDATVFGLCYHSRDLLYRRIDARVDAMLAAGLWDEVVRLERAGVFAANATAAQAIGYKEFLGVLRGEITREQAVEALKLATRHYAKRQLTWFSAKPYVTWLYADTPEGIMRPPEEVLAEAMGHLAAHGKGAAPC